MLQNKANYIKSLNAIEGDAIITQRDIDITNIVNNFTSHNPRAVLNFMTMGIIEKSKFLNSMPDFRPVPNYSDKNTWTASALYEVQVNINKNTQGMLVHDLVRLNKDVLGLPFNNRERIDIPEFNLKLRVIKTDGKDEFHEVITTIYNDCELTLLDTRTSVDCIKSRFYQQWVETQVEYLKEEIEEKRNKYNIKYSDCVGLDNPRLVFTEKLKPYTQCYFGVEGLKRYAHLEGSIMVLASDATREEIIETDCIDHYVSDRDKAVFKTINVSETDTVVYSVSWEKSKFIKTITVFKDLARKKLANSLHYVYQWMYTESEILSTNVKEEAVIELDKLFKAFPNFKEYSNKVSHFDVSEYEKRIEAENKLLVFPHQVNKYCKEDLMFAFIYSNFRTPELIRLRSLLNKNEVRQELEKAFREVGAESDEVSTYINYLDNSTMEQSQAVPITKEELEEKLSELYDDDIVDVIEDAFDAEKNELKLQVDCNALDTLYLTTSQETIKDMCRFTALLIRILDDKVSEKDYEEFKRIGQEYRFTRLLHEFNALCEVMERYK